MSVRRKLLLLRPSRDEHTVIREDILYYGDSVTNNIDSIILSPKDYEEIYNYTRSQSPMRLKRLPVVKVTYDGKSIHRRYLGESKLKDTDCAAMNYSSLIELVNESSKDVVGHEVTLSKGCRFLYFWNHPFHAARISTRLGIFSIALAIFSIILNCIICLCR